MGIIIVVFFISPCACFSYAQLSFFKYIKKTVSTLSKSFSLLFVIKHFYGESIWRLSRAKYAPHPYLGNFLRIW